MGRKALRVDYRAAGATIDLKVAHSGLQACGQVLASPESHGGVPENWYAGRAPGGNLRAPPTKTCSGGCGGQSPPPVLGNTTEKLSQVARTRRMRRDQRYRLRDILQDVTRIPRLGICGIRRIAGRTEPEIRRRPSEEAGGMVAHFANLALCGRVWLCPVCGPKIRDRRAHELDLACASWIRTYGVGSVMLLTLTMPHDFGQPLDQLFGTVRAAFTSLVSGRAWGVNKGRFDLAHWVRAYDVTIGPNGWHPHLHVVVLGRRGLSAHELTDLEGDLFARWRNTITAKGFRAPSREHGIRLEQARTKGDLSRYVCQVIVGSDESSLPVALEVARGDLKVSRKSGHRTPWQVLGDFAETGDATDLSIWREWEQASSWVHAIRWSNGLRHEAGLGEEQTDEEVVAVEVGGEVVYVFAMTDWAILCRIRGGRGEVLRVAEESGGGGVVQFIEEVRAKALKLDPMNGPALERL